MYGYDEQRSINSLPEVDLFCEAIEGLAETLGQLLDDMAVRAAFQAQIDMAAQIQRMEAQMRHERETRRFEREQQQLKRQYDEHRTQHAEAHQKPCEQQHDPTHGEHAQTQVQHSTQQATGVKVATKGSLAAKLDARAQPAQTNAPVQRQPSLGYGRSL